MRKQKIFYGIILFFVIACLVIYMCIPNIGNLVLVKEIIGIAIMILFEIAVLKLFFLIIKSKNYINIVMISFVFIIIASVVCLKGNDVFKDITSGPTNLTLYNCSVEKRSTLKGIFGLNYYLHGLDSEGEKYSFEISGSEFDALKGKREITIFCYMNTEKIIEVRKVGENT